MPKFKPVSEMSEKVNPRYICQGCGATFGSFHALSGHQGRCYWYLKYKNDGNLEDAPFYEEAEERKKVRRKRAAQQKYRRNEAW